MKESFRLLSDLSEVRETLSRILLLGGISGDAFENMIGYFEGTAFKTAACIIRKGELPTHIYIIQSDRVELCIADGATNLRKCVFVVGESFGEVAMLSMINDTASFCATKDCELITISRKSLARLSKEEPLIFGQVMPNLAHDLAGKVQYSDELMLRGGDT